MTQAALAFPEPQAFDAEMQDALALCKGDALMALRITLIANAFLEAEIDQLNAQVSADYSRKRKA